MTSIGLGLIVALGSVIGAAVATPHEEFRAVFMFILFNSTVSALAFHMGMHVVRFYRDMTAWKR